MTVSLMIDKGMPSSCSAFCRPRESGWSNNRNNAPGVRTGPEYGS